MSQPLKTTGSKIVGVRRLLTSKGYDELMEGDFYPASFEKNIIHEFDSSPNFNKDFLFGLWNITKKTIIYNQDGHSFDYTGFSILNSMSIHYDGDGRGNSELGIVKSFIYQYTGHYSLADRTYEIFNLTSTKMIARVKYYTGSIVDIEATKG